MRGFAARVCVWGLLMIMVAAGLPGSSSARSEPSSRTRGYMTTPNELNEVARKASEGIEPYASAVDEVMRWARRGWDYQLDRVEECRSENRPAWLDNTRGGARLYARALAYRLTSDDRYAAEVKDIIERIITQVESISLEEQNCRLNFGWGTPELVASADLIEDYWHDMTCTGPTSTVYGENELGEGPCRMMLQNWLVKNPYYVVSLSAEESQSNWGSAATTTLAYIADYLWDRPDVEIVHRLPPQLGKGDVLVMSPAKAYDRANLIALDRMNGYRVEFHSQDACDYMSGSQQSGNWPPVKSQITENGTIPEDARREEFCNIVNYNGSYQNYPQIHLGNAIQQCELMLRRGDPSCYDNVDQTDLPMYTFVGTDGELHSTHLYPGRGSIERAINAIIINSGTEWRHDSALEVAYRYYYVYGKLGHMAEWLAELDQPTGCDQDICFGTLTHGFAPGEDITPTAVILPPDSP